MRRFLNAGGASVIALVVGSLFPAAALAQDTGTAAPTASPGPLPVDDTEIVVTGIRRSIQEALTTKREAINVVDAISAQDIGKLPDQNVVESLGRVPGVQITRGEGDGSGFTVRGISLNTVLLNGRPFTPATADSTSKLDTISPDIFSSLEVIKSPSADMVEGALGGTVNLKTKRPLDLANSLISVRAQADYGDQIKRLGYRVSGLISQKFFDGQLGILANVAYQERSNRQEVFDTVGWTRTNNIDGNGDGVNDANLFRPLRLSSNVNPRYTDRLTASGALQWRPSDSFSLLIEATHNRFNLNRKSNRFQMLLNDNDVGARANANGTVISSTITGITLRPLIYNEIEKYRNTIIGANAEWKTGPLTLTADASFSSGKSPIGFAGNSSSSFVPLFVPRAGRTVDATFNFGSSQVPDYALRTNFDVADPTNYQYTTLVDGYSVIDNQSKNARLDANYALDLGAFESVDVGVRYEDRRLFTERFQRNVPAAESLALADRNRDGIITYDEIPGISLVGNLANPFFSGLSGNFIRVFPDGTLNTETTRTNLGVLTTPLLPSETKDVQQKTKAAYVKLNFRGDAFSLPFRAHVGVRVVGTDRVSSGFVVQPNGSFVPVRFNKSYTEFLPSAAISVDLTDKLLFRAAVARVSASPPLNDLSAGVSVTITNNSGSGGNPLLEPYRTDQLDVGLEWYFGPASILAGGIFYKKVASFTQTTITNETVPGYLDVNGNGTVFRIARPTNGSDGSVKGFEVNYQQAFTFLPKPFNGLGLQANYTYADSKTPTIEELTGQTLPLPQLSKHSYSLIGYYENEKVSFRVAYTYRSEYLLNIQTAASAGSRFVAAQNSLDASFSYAIGPNFKFILDATNLLRRPEYRYDGVRERVTTILRDDTRVQAGFTATF